jgi:hypothetical protein
MITSGRKKQENLNGNFGAARIQGKRDSLDLTKEILNRENLRIPQRDEAFTKLVQAYNTTTDPRLKAGLWEILKKRKATLTPIKVKSNERPESPYWEDIRRVRG